jgi:hypothetical protein
MSRNLVRKAYVELEELGIVKMIQGKGVMVNRNLKYKKDEELLLAAEKLAEATRKKCQSTGLVFSSFARYLYHKAIEVEQEQSPLMFVDISSDLARERADQISQMLNVRIEGISTEDLKGLAKNGKLGRDTKIICNYYRFEELRKILRGKSVDIVPLRMMLSEKTKNELNALPTGSKVIFIFDEKDQATLSLILEDYRKTFADHHLEFISRSDRDIKSVLRGDAYTELLVSNRIWNSIPEEIRRARNVTHPVMEFDPSSIEESKTQFGVIA